MYLLASTSLLLLLALIGTVGSMGSNLKFGCEPFERVNRFVSGHVSPLRTVSAGGSAGKTIPTVDAVLGGNVTLKAAAPVSPYDVLIWAYSDGENVPVSVITLSGGTEKAQARYAGRASLNRTTGSLTLTSLRSADSGHYTLTVVADGVATSDEVKLQVLGE